MNVINDHSLQVAIVSLGKMLYLYLGRDQSAAPAATAGVARHDRASDKELDRPFEWPRRSGAFSRLLRSLPARVAAWRER